MGVMPAKLLCFLRFLMLKIFLYSPTTQSL